MSRQPVDENGNRIPALQAVLGGSLQLTAGVASSTTAFKFPNAQVYEIYAPYDIRYQTGGSDVVASATSHFLAAGERLIRSKGNPVSLATHISVIRVGSSDVGVEVSELV